MFLTWEEKFRISKRLYIVIMHNDVFGDFPKILQNLSEGQTNVCEHFPKISEDRQILSQASESKNIQSCFDHTPTNLWPGTGQKCYQNDITCGCHNHISPGDMLLPLLSMGVLSILKTVWILCYDCNVERYCFITLRRQELGVIQHFILHTGIAKFNFWINFDLGLLLIIRNIIQEVRFFSW